MADPDSRLMKLHQLNKQVSYNVQSAVDTKHHLIVSHDIVQSNDRGIFSKSLFKYDKEKDIYT